MIFKKAFNNNVALALDDSGNEVVVMGKAIGFQRKEGDSLDGCKVEKQFFLGDSVYDGKMSQILRDIPMDIILLTDTIVEEGKKILQKKLNQSIVLTLSDHINFAIIRAKEGIDFNNPLQWEIKRLYPKEYEVGKKAVEIIRDSMKVELPKSEASLIALHFVNAQLDSGKMQETLEMTEIVSEILNIVNNHFKIELDEESLNYSRFLTHLQYFVLRQMNRKPVDISDDRALYELIMKKYGKSFKCVLEIQNHLHDKYNWEITDDEIAYLVLHIQRVTTS